MRNKVLKGKNCWLQVLFRLLLKTCLAKRKSFHVIVTVAPFTEYLL